MYFEKYIRFFLIQVEMGVGYAETWNKVIMAVEAEMVKKKR